MLGKESLPQRVVYLVRAGMEEVFPFQPQLEAQLARQCRAEGQGRFPPCEIVQERAQFTALEPLDAKNLGAWVYPREDWDEVRISEMARVLKAKFTQNPQLGRWLVSTAGSVLAEGNTWDDRFWGVNLYTGEGENNLGKLLMALREELLALGGEYARTAAMQGEEGEADAE